MKQEILQQKRKRAPGAGRKPKDGAANLKHYSVLMTVQHAEKAKQLGEGETSLGVRRAIERA